MTFSQEPALWIAVIDAILVLAVTFGLPLEPEQKGAIDTVLAALAGVVIRSQVTPVKRVKSVAPPPAPAPPEVVVPHG